MWVFFSHSTFADRYNTRSNFFWKELRIRHTNFRIDCFSHMEIKISGVYNTKGVEGWFKAIREKKLVDHPQMIWTTIFTTTTYLFFYLLSVERSKGLQQLVIGSGALPLSTYLSSVDEEKWLNSVLVNNRRRSHQCVYNENKGHCSNNIYAQLVLSFSFYNPPFILLKSVEPLFHSTF